MLEVLLTREDANTEFALLAEWLAADGQAVTSGEPVCVIETTKATVEVEAPGAGTLVHLFDAGAEVELGGAVGLVAKSAVELEEARGRRRPPPDVAPADGAKATRKARELAERHGVDLATIAKRGFITTADVEAVIAGGSAPIAGEVDRSLLGGVDTAGVTLPSSWAEGEDRGVIDPALLESLRRDPDAFRQLSSAEKCETYREHGAVIGDGVGLGDGSLIIAGRLVLEAGVQLGARTTVDCAEAFCVGELTHLGPDLEVRCRRMLIGANVHGGRSMRIGGGGHRDPWAVVAVGDLTFLGDEIFVNACRPVLIGRETFITQRSMIVTHNVGHSLLDGYENRFAAVVVEDYAQVGLGAVIYAGCRIGQRAIVASNSYVVSDIPAGKLAIGVPAKPAGESQIKLSPSRQAELAHQMLEDFYTLLSLKGHDVAWLETGAARCFAVSAPAAPGQVAFIEELRTGDELPPPAETGESVVMTLAVGDSETPAGWTVLDLVGRGVYGSGGSLADTTREFCRKRGIRFMGAPWRYAGELI